MRNFPRRPARRVYSKKGGGIAKIRVGHGLARHYGLSMARMDSLDFHGDVTGFGRMAAAPECDAAFSRPRDPLNNRFVYLVISSRAGGLSVNVNLNPVVKCNFSCAYCEVDRSQAPRAARLDIDGMAQELCDTVNLINSGQLRTRPPYDKLPSQLLKMQHVALSGDGEPTLAPLFVEAMQEIIHVRAVHRVPYFKIVLLTNSSALDHQEVLDNIKLLTREDEIWAKLDAGTQEYFRGSTLLCCRSSTFARTFSILPASDRSSSKAFSPKLTGSSLRPRKSAPTPTA